MIVFVLPKLITASCGWASQVLFELIIEWGQVKAAGKTTLTIGCKFQQKLRGQIIDEDVADTYMHIHTYS